MRCKSSSANPVARVLDLDAGPLAARRIRSTRAAHVDAPLRRFVFVNRLGGVAQEIEERLSEHALVGAHFRKVALDVRATRRSSKKCAQVCGAVFEQLAQVTRRRGRAASGARS